MAMIHSGIDRMRQVQYAFSMASHESEAALTDPLDQLLGYQLRRASALIVADLAASLSDVGLRVTEASILMMIDVNPQVTQSEIGRCLGVKRANMAPLVSGLELRRLIERSPVDGRSQALRLTAKGHELAQRGRDLVAAHEERIFAEIPDEKRRIMIEALKSIRSHDTD